MKREKQYNRIYNKTIGISVLLTVTVVLIMGLIYFSIYINRLIDTVKQEAIVILENISSQNITILKNTLENKQIALYSLALEIEREQKYNIEELIEYLKLYVQMDSIYSMGIIDKEGICYNTLGEQLDLSGYDYFTEGMKGISKITTSYVSQNKIELLNIFTTPIYKDGKVEMVLTAACKSSDFSEILTVYSFDGKGQSIVVDKEGQLVTSPNDIPEVNLNGKYLINVDKQEISKIINDTIKKSNEKFFEFAYRDEPYIAYYEPIGINDWNLISYVPKNYLCSNIYEIRDAIFRGSIYIYIACIIFLIMLICEHIIHKRKMTQMLFYDDITNEKNYEYLKICFDNMSEKDRQQKSLIVMDIDKFKSINIIYGNRTGDKVLKYIPFIFKKLLPNDEIYKYQSDIFIAIVNNTLQEEIINKITKIENKIQEDIEQKKIVPIKLYFGVCSLDKFEDLNSIYNNALIAKNEIKKSVNRNINFFNEMDKKKFIEKQTIEFEFMEAFKDKEFEVWYQPKYNISTKEIYGSEALVRWRKKDGSFVLPSNFIPVLEDTGQIIQLDEAVIEMVFQDIGEMRISGLDIKPISINLSRVQATNFEIIDKIEELMKYYKISPSDVSFEITESALSEDNDSINKIISKLHHIGFKVDIDDYGIGKSTLNAIFASDFDTLKLDKTFSDNIGNPKMEVIIKSTIKMANELNMTVIAEGVETKEQIEFLVKNNCNIAQGYYLSKPLSKEEYFNLIKEHYVKSNKQF